MGWLRVAIVASFVSLLGLPAWSETRALLVGVAGYPNLPERLRLEGPRNDVPAVARTLAGFGVAPDRMRVLVDGVADIGDGIAVDGPATRQAILDGLDRLAGDSGPGDLVVFYYSGHGAQQPDLDGDEQGGADEIFLPYDVGSWTGAGVEGALIDDELRAAFDRILATGADVFGIIDACHSATGFRNLAADDVRTRRVDPAALGVPDSEITMSRSLTGPQAAVGIGRGRAAFFYAAQENEEALEKTPRGAETDDSYGVFTHALLQRLRASPGLTYRTLHGAVVNDIKRSTMMATQTPDLEGELLDEPVLGLGAAEPVRQWPIFAGKLKGGRLDGLGEGTVLALYSDPAAAEADRVAFGRVALAGAVESRVTALADRCAEGACAEEGDKDAFRKARIARVHKAVADFSLILSEPVRIDPDDGRDYAGPRAALDQALMDPGLAGRVQTQPAGFDVAVALVDGTLAFSATAGGVDAAGPGSSPRLSLPEDPGEASMQVVDALERMARVAALQRIGDGAGGALGLGVELWLSRNQAGSIVDGACPEDRAAYDPAVQAGPAPVADDCDILSAVMRNRGSKPLDVTALLIGPDFAITTVWPISGQINRIHPGETKTADLVRMEPNPAAASDERLIFVAVPGVNRSHTVFDSLDQTGLRAVPAGADPAADAARAFLRAAVQDFSRDRAATPAALNEQLAVDVKPFHVAVGEAGR